MAEFDGYKKSTEQDNRPDPDLSKVKINGAFVLVRPKPVENKIGSILMPDSFTDDASYLTNIGRVLKVGDLAFEEPVPGENRFGKNRWCSEGDYVVWRKHGGHKVILDGVICVFLMDDEILMTLEDPNQLDVMKNTVRY
jgi:co-chaperonin GroES (HSP10)